LVEILGWWPKLTEHQTDNLRQINFVEDEDRGSRVGCANAKPYPPKISSFLPFFSKDSPN
jgi:hypothetical protein